MRFSRISISKKLVSLSWQEQRGHGTVTHVYESKDKPLPSFNGALQAFAGWSLKLLGAPPEWDDAITVTTVNLSERDGKRGIQVSFSKRVDQANGAASSITTPLMREADNLDGEIATGYYGSHIDELIEQLEVEASRYEKGERDQTEMFDKTEGQAAPKGRKKGKTDPKAGTPGEVANPGKTLPPADETLRKLLLDAGRDVPIDAIATWGSADRDKAQNWAAAQLRVKSGDLRAEAAPKEPKILLQYATPALIEA